MQIALFEIDILSRWRDIIKKKNAFHLKAYVILYIYYA